MAAHSSCLENPVDRGAWRATVHRVTKSWTQLKGLNTHAHTEDIVKESPLPPDNLGTSRNWHSLLLCIHMAIYAYLGMPNHRQITI